MNSLELTRHLHNHGFLRKEAAVRVLRRRNAMIKSAMIDLTNEYFGFEKKAVSIFGIGKGGGGASRAAEAAEKAALKKPTIAMGRSLRNIAPLLGLAGLVTLGSTAAKVGLGALGDLKTKGELEDSYAGIFKEFPDLKENKGQASKYFAMMSKYAPSLASNPIIAGTWIKQMMNMNVVDPKNIHALISAQSDWEDVRSMKSPLISFSRDFPQTRDLFSQAIAASSLGSE
jgi:hypothetical protein